MENPSTPNPASGQVAPASDQIDVSQEDNLSNIASIILMLGIVSSVILFFSMGLETRPSLYGTGTETGFNGVGVALTLGSLLSAIVTYYVLQVLGSISKSLKRLVAKS
jgi:hypothetical protein